MRFHPLKLLLRSYDDSGFVIQRKARMLAIFCLVVFVVLPVAAIYSTLIGGTIEAGVLGPELIGMVPVTIALILLAKGRFAIAGHIVLTAGTLVVWAVLIFDQHAPIIKLDSMAYIYAAMSAVPLLVTRSRSEVLGYSALNLSMHILFSVVWLPELDIERKEMLDYFVDNLVALVMVAIAIFHVFDINQRALDRAKQDIEDRKRAEKELKRLEGLLRNVVDSMPSSLIGLNPDGEVTQWSQETERRTGIKAEQALGRRFAEVLPELAHETEKVRKAISEQATQRDERIPIVLGGETRYHEITVYPLVSNGTDGAVLRIDDVTEKLRIEEMMMQSEKMLSIGGLAAGMAHEINNPLAGILQNLQLLRIRLERDHRKNLAAAQALGVSMDTITEYCLERGIDQILDSIEASGRRAAQIVNSMLSFSRKSNAKLSPQDLGELLDETCELASSEYNPRNPFDFRAVQIVREYHDEVPEVTCDGNQVQQVFFNLITNAAHAMAENSPETKPLLILRLVRDKDLVRIEVEDNGPGMDDETCKRVFEPFFTTKEVGVGTGLGLSVAYFIITEQHRGTIEVDSTPGIGTRFTVKLPTA